MDKFRRVFSGTQNSESQYILVLGETGSGKTSFINEVSGSNLKISDDIESCTTIIELSKTFTMMDRELAMIDTPGFDDTNRTDAEVLADIALWLGKSFVKKQSIVGVVYLHSLENVRAGGAAIRNIEMVRELVGERAAKNVVIGTTKWDILPKDVTDQRHKRLSETPEIFGNLRDNGAQIMECWPNRQSRQEVVEKLLQKDQAQPLQVQIEIAVDRKRVGETAAGQVLQQHRQQEEEERNRKLEEERVRIETQSEGLPASEIKAMRQNLKSIQKLADKESKVKDKALDRHL